MARNLMTCGGVWLHFFFTSVSLFFHTENKWGKFKKIRPVCVGAIRSHAISDKASIPKICFKNLFDSYSYCIELETLIRKYIESYVIDVQLERYWC